MLLLMLLLLLMQRGNEKRECGIKETLPRMKTVPPAFPCLPSSARYKHKCYKHYYTNNSNIEPNSKRTRCLERRSALRPCLPRCIPSLLFFAIKCVKSAVPCFGKKKKAMPGRVRTKCPSACSVHKRIKIIKLIGRVPHREFMFGPE